MRFKDRKLNFDNYRDILLEEGFSQDVLDEVRGAIMDQVELGGFLDSCRDDPFRLQQVRLSMKEGIDPVFLKLSGASLYKLRKAISSGVVSMYVRGVADLGVTGKAFDTVLDLDSRGYSLQKYNFSIIPNHLLDQFKAGIENGLPMFLLNTGRVYSVEFVNNIMLLMTSKRDVKRAIEEEWSSDVLRELSSLRKPFYDEILGYVSKGTSAEYISAWGECLEHGLSLDELASKDSVTGYEVYMPSQIYFIADCAGDGFEVDDMLDPRLSMEELYVIKQELRVKTGRKLRGVLGSRSKISRD